MSESLLLIRDSFDPIGRGHLDLASAASLRLGCQVVFMPTKEGVAPALNRIQMLVMMLKKEHGVGYSIDPYEIDAEGKTSLLGSLRQIRLDNPHKTIYLALGPKEINKLDENEIEYIPSLAKVLYIAGDGKLVPDGKKLSDLKVQRFPYGKIGDAYEENIRNLRSLDISLQVRDYIEKHELYYIKRLAAYLSPKRLRHSISVANLAYFIAMKNKVVSPSQAYIAGLIHDIAKNVPEERARRLMKEYFPEIGLCPAWTLHQFIGPLFAQSEFGITDSEILEAVRFHATGKAHMSPIGKIIYASDKIEPTRGFDSGDLIDACLKNYYIGFLTVLKANKEYLEDKGYVPDNPFTKACFAIYLGDE